MSSTTSVTSGGGSSSKERSRKREAFSTGVIRGCATFGVSLQEGFRYLKATLVGQTKKLRAQTEKEVTEADMMAAKKQVDAADAAENAKKRINEFA